jgi:hypothetical protein
MSEYDHNYRSEAEERILREGFDIPFFPSGTARRDKLAWALCAWADVKEGRTPYDLRHGMRETREELGLADPEGLAKMAIAALPDDMAADCDASDLRGLAWRLSWRHGAKRV